VNGAGTEIATQARHFVSLVDAGADTVAQLVQRSLEIAAGDHDESLQGRRVGIYFRRTSTRTRTAFWAGSIQLGADVIMYGPDDLQVVTGETVEDTARVLSNYLDVLVIRTNEPMSEMRALAANSRMSVVNALSEEEHPTQAIADLTVLKEEFGTLGLHVLYLGEGNNTAVALAFAAAMTPGLRLTLVAPAGYGLPDGVHAEVRRLADEHGGYVEEHNDVTRLPAPVDAVYTTRWQTMGVEKTDPGWRDLFAPFKVTSALLEEVAGPSTIFLHDLPATRGAEVDDDVIDGPRSRVLRQAYHKMTSAMAVMEWCTAGRSPV
jgi:ornithine carbamoyltransferase